MEEDLSFVNINWKWGVCPPLWTREVKSERGRGACKRKRRAPSTNSRARGRLYGFSASGGGRKSLSAEGGSQLLWVHKGEAQAAAAAAVAAAAAALGLRWRMSATSVDQRPKGQGNKVSVQNGSIHQKDAVNDDDFEPYLSSQTNQVSLTVACLGNETIDFLK